MKKNTLLKNKIFPKVLVFIFAVLSLSTISPRAHAGVCDNEFLTQSFYINMFCKAKDVYSLVSSPRTATDLLAHSMTGFPTFLAFNSSPDELGQCGVFMAGSMEVEGGGTVLDRVRTIAGVHRDDGSTEIFTQTDIDAANAAGPELNCDFNNTVMGGRVAGSLMGMTKMAYDTLITEPVPVNLAYYFNHEAKKVPFVNQTALAATTYNAWGLELFIVLWEKARNIAYVMMSVIMLVIGILIITRKKINPQTVVTVQTALPRVFISLILITFSYPIGATMASAIMPLVVLVYRFFFGAVMSLLADMDLLVVIFTVVTAIIGPSGTIGLFTGILMMLLTVIAMFVALIKVLLVYLKILLSIVFAPIQFAMAAIPGQEGLITTWFKQMIARVLGIPAIFFMIALSYYILYVPFIGTSAIFSNTINPQQGDVLTVGFSFLRAAASRNLTIMLLPILTTMIMFMAIKMDKKVEDLIMGEKKRR